MTLQLTGLVGLFQQVAEVFIVMLGAGDLERGGQRDGAVLHCLDQALLPLFQQENDVPDIFFRKPRALDEVIKCVVTRKQELDIGEDLQRTVTAPGDIFG